MASDSCPSMSSVRRRPRRHGTNEGILEQEESDRQPPPAKRRKRNTGDSLDIERSTTPKTTAGCGSTSNAVPEHHNLRRTTRRGSQVSGKSPTPPLKKEPAELLYGVGDRLEARDEYGKWYAARVSSVDEEAKSILIHFDYWSTRYDEWIDATSTRLRRMVEQPRDEKDSPYKIGDFVSAKWSMSKRYPAKILDIVNESRFNVMFYDGVESVVKKRQIRPLPEAEVQKLDLANFGQPNYVLPGTTIKKEDEESEETPTAEEKQGFVLKGVRKKDRFLTTTQKWMLRQLGENRSQRRAAAGVSLAVARLTTPARGGKKENRATASTSVSESTSPNTSGGSTSRTKQRKGSKTDQLQSSTRKSLPRQSSENEPLSTLKSPKMEPPSPPPVATLIYDPIVLVKPLGNTATTEGTQTGSLEDTRTSAYYRSFKFKPEWCEEFKWILYENGTMYCKHCRLTYPEAKHGFVQGITAGFLLHRLHGHAKSKFHLAALEEAAESSQPVKLKPKSSQARGPPPDQLRQSPDTESSKSNTDADQEVAAISPAGAVGPEAERAQRLFLFWSNGRESWLRMEKDKFFCRACRLYGTNTGPGGLWSTGVPLNQASNIRRHGQSPAHLVALQQLTEMGGSEEVEPAVTGPEFAFTEEGPRPEMTVLPKVERGRKRRRSVTSEASLDSSSCSHSVSTVTAIETVSSERKRHESQEEGVQSDRDSSPSSSLSHLAEDDVVRCVCEMGGEDGLMLQCEQCLTWQHGGCVGISSPESMPSVYICYLCKDPPGSRPNMRYRYEVQKAWLESGTLPRYPWSATDPSTEFLKAKVAESTNNVTRTVVLLNDRLKAARALIQQANKIPHGPATVDRKAALKDEISAIQDAVEKEMDTLEPFVTELETKYFNGRARADEYNQSKMAVNNLLLDLDKLRKLEYFLQ